MSSQHGDEEGARPRVGQGKTKFDDRFGLLERCRRARIRADAVFAAWRSPSVPGRENNASIFRSTSRRIERVRSCSGDDGRRHNALELRPRACGAQPDQQHSAPGRDDVPALVDGNPRVTCAIPADHVHGKHIVTLEGLAASDRELVARSFAATAAVHCGFCIPNFLTSSLPLVCPRPPAALEHQAHVADHH